MHTPAPNEDGPLEAESERRTVEYAIGQNLHANLCQHLSAASLCLECLRSAYAKGEHARVEELLSRLAALIQDSVTSTHRLTNCLLEGKAFDLPTDRPPPSRPSNQGDC